MWYLQLQNENIFKNKKVFKITKDDIKAVDKILYKFRWQK